MIVILRRRKLGNTSCMAIKEFSEHDVTIVRNDRVLTSSPNADILIRWGCSSIYPKSSGCVVLNKTESMHLTNDKSAFRRVCEENNVVIPRTYYTSDNLPSSIFPAILRPTHHSQGRRLYFLKDIGEFNRLRRMGKVPSRYYVSEFIDKDAEVRVYCMSGRVVAMANKEVNNKGAIAWNHATGNSLFRNMRWNNWHVLSAIEGLKAFNTSGLEFGGVDVMIKGNNVYVLEINAAPSLTSSYRQRCFSRGIDYLINEINGNHEKPYFDFPKSIKKWSDLVHPYLLENRIGEPPDN